VTVATTVDVNTKATPDHIADLVASLSALLANKIKGCVNSHPSLPHSLDHSRYLLDLVEVVDVQLN
jgi:hypothetical protein